jgi:hypothetical protein
VLNVPCRVFDIELLLRAVMLLGGRNEENPAPTEGPNLYTPSDRISDSIGGDLNVAFACRKVY